MGRATLVALVVTGMATVGSGVAFAHGDGHQHHERHHGFGDDFGYGRGHGATVEGGSSTVAGVFQQNTAQTHGQNTNCSNTEDRFNGPSMLSGGRTVFRCVTGDASFNKDTVVEHRGAHVLGGSSAGDVNQQNTAQQGRQNTNCNNANGPGITLTGGRTDGRCVNLDGSRNKETLVRSGGAKTSGGFSPENIVQQNTAQEGRQNNDCANPNDLFATVSGSRTDHRCANRDGSRNKHAVVKRRGAEADGGSGGLTTVFQQNVSQEGRQNNKCGSPSIEFPTLTGSRTDSRCRNRDHSRNKGTLVESGGAEADGGSSATGGVSQQNTAQEGRQNNNCDNHNGQFDFTLQGARVRERCFTEDGSLNKGTLVKGGGARADGGSVSARFAVVGQQNTAQEGRQNNSCGNHDNARTTLTGSRTEDSCAAIDRSANVGAAEVSRGADTDGGSSVMNLFQQNTAQEGRQNNACGNPNSLTLTATGSRLRTGCLAVDESRNFDTVER